LPDANDMNICLVLDQMAQRYGCLPSKIMAEGDIIDMGIMIKSIAWHNEVAERQQKGHRMPRITQYSESQLLDMIAQARK